MIEIAKNLKFKKVNNQFQNQLRDDLKNIRNEDRVIVSADKTRNHYKMETQKYKDHLNNNITKDYKKADEKVVKDITRNDIKVASKLEIADRVYCTSKRNTFITLKDHKPQYMNNPKFRVINPTKSELGKVSKQMLSEIISTVKTKLQLLQFKNSDEAIDWFSNLQNKQRLHFIQFDVVNFYASITPDLLKSAITFAARYTTISAKYRETILQAANSFLFSDNATWIKKQGGIFDITMGSFHGAEICDLVGLYLLSQLVQVLPKGQIGLYRDDGLAVSSASCRQNDIIKKKICKIFEENGLSITIDVNVKIVNFLDVTFDLSKGIYKPHMKENDSPVYVDVNSNHPPMVLKNIPMGVNRRLSRISSSKEIFDDAKQPYQDALNKSGYKHKLEYLPNKDLPKAKRNRHRPVTWFNPPFSLNVRSRVGREFLSLLDTSFPPSNPLHKLFNRNTVKLSYRRMPNMAQAVANHNSKLLSERAVEEPGCNCMGGKHSCPVDGKCGTAGVIYEAVVTEVTSGKKETYTGLTNRRFKDRLYEHTTSFNKRGDKKTALSSHIWSLKDRGIQYDLSWRLKDRAATYNPATKSCRLCLKEKWHILYKADGATLNRRSEIFNSCMHKSNLLSNLKT